MSRATSHASYLGRGPRALLAWGALAAHAVLLAGCGHPATRAECEEIFRRSAEIELRSLNVTEPDEVQRRTEEAKDARGAELLERCVGRRITDRAMRCVRDARTEEELDGCLM